MAQRPCLDCGRLTPGTRCPACTSARSRARDARRGNRHQRGYDSTHDDIRTDLLARLKPGELCDRCNQPMTAEQALDAAHPHDRPLRLDRSSRADHLEHSSCNRGAQD
jgi:5-methylcytosine-specific restriction endonuclease McrA